MFLLRFPNNLVFELIGNYPVFFNLLQTHTKCNKPIKISFGKCELILESCHDVERV